MFIGSNNTLTYLEPSNMWFKMFKNLGQCQNIDYELQYTLWSARLFDFRLYSDKHGHIIIKNGHYEYPLFSLYEVLDYLNKRGDAIVYITLDNYKAYETEKEKENIKKRLHEYCRVIESIYEETMFCGGYARSDGEEIYSFEWEKQHGRPTLIEPMEWSRTYRFISKWCPIFIKKLNKKYIEQFKDKNGYLMLNYINKR
jgi:hypothetical protein